MPNKLLGVAGFTADKVAKSFSVNEHGHINVAGDIEGAIIGSVVEPYGPNYQGVVAVMGRQVLAGAEIESFTGSCRYLGSSGNRLFFQNSVNSTVITITNLNLQPIGTHTIPEDIAGDGAYRGKMFAKDGYFVYSTAGGEVVIKTDRFEEVLRLDRDGSQSVLIHNNMLIKTENKSADNPSPKLSFYELPTGDLVKTIDIVDEIVGPVTDGVVGLFTLYIAADGDKLVLAVRAGGGTQQDVQPSLNIIDLNNYSIVNGIQPQGFNTVDGMGAHDGTLYYVPYNSGGIGWIRYMSIDNPTDFGVVGRVYSKDAGLGTSDRDSFIAGDILSINQYQMSREPNRILYKNKMQEVAPGAHLYNWSAGRDHLGRIVMCTSGYAMILSEELVLKGYRVVES